jgi:hypothetical protein
LSAGVVATSVSPHVVYIHDRSTVAAPTPPPGAALQYFYVDIPEDVYPGEVFRAMVNGREVLVTCPEISGPGERLVIGVPGPAGHTVNATPAYATTTAYASTPAYAPAPTYAAAPTYASTPTYAQEPEYAPTSYLYGQPALPGPPPGQAVQVQVNVTTAVPVPSAPPQQQSQGYVIPHGVAMK